jgi:ribosome-associated protein
LEELAGDFRPRSHCGFRPPYLLSQRLGRAGGAAFSPGAYEPENAAFQRGKAAGLDVPTGKARSAFRNRDPLPERSIEEEVTPIPRAKTPAKPRRKAKPTPTPTQKLLTLTEQLLDDGKAEDIAAIDLQGKSDIADFMVIATGRSQRQVVALAQRLTEGLKKAGCGKVAVEGLRQGEWVLIDAGDIVVHLFKPETRTYYNLEKMWGETLSEAAGQ